MSILSTLMGGSGRKCPACSSNSWVSTFSGKTCNECGFFEEDLKKALRTDFDGWNPKTLQKKISDIDTTED